MPNDYEVAHKARKAEQSSALPPSDKKTITPKYLLGHENHFDPNVFTPEQMIQQGVLKGKPNEVKTT